MLPLPMSPTVQPIVSIEGVEFSKLGPFFSVIFW